MKNNKKESCSRNPGAGIFSALVEITLLIGIIGLFLFAAPKAAAYDSFNITNVLSYGTTITGWPTNSASTNFYITSFVTNGTTITTNGYYPSQSTGRYIETRNYTFNGFKFQGLCSSSNGMNLLFYPVRAIANNPPSAAYSATTNSATVTLFDFETTPQTILTVPIPRGTNVPVTWMTNLDEWFTKAGDYVGIYQVVPTNGTPGNIVSNAAAGLGKKIIPFSLSGGNY